jgi:hypothetical protein
MIDRLRALLDRPLDPSAARAIVVFASALLVGLAALFLLAAGEGGPAEHSVATAPRPPLAAAAAPSDRAISGTGQAGYPASHVPRVARQDPQDRTGSAAAGRAATALRFHRALQHVPYRRPHLTVRLIGARGDRAVLVVSAPTIGAARRGWQAFLRRFSDSGHAYLVRFAARGGRHA